VSQFGHTAEDFTSEKLLYGNIIHKEDIKAVIENLALSIREGNDSFEMEYRIFTGDGNIAGLRSGHLSRETVKEM